MANTENIEMHVLPGGDGAAVYVDGTLVDTGHLDDVSERLIARLGVTVEYTDFIVDKTARGWSGVAKTLADLPRTNG